MFSIRLVACVRPTDVVARLSGGLGNQMFQYAAGRSLAQRAGAQVGQVALELVACLLRGVADLLPQR